MSNTIGVKYFKLWNIQNKLELFCENVNNQAISKL